MREKWELILRERYGHIEYKSSKRNGRQKRRRNLGVRAKTNWIRYWRQDIPANYEVHHVDGNIRNNYILNLALVTTGYHDLLHGRTRNRGK
jgi:hypothetical protein